jgi:tryptophan synthase alpha chain
MNKIDAAFQESSSPLLIGYVPAGYPDMSTTLEIVPKLAESGCDIIELGIPFSDPIGDGPVIQQASFRSLEKGTTATACLELAGELEKRTPVPLLFMTYFNPIMHFGPENFVVSAARNGIQGLIVPDLPPEESTELAGSCQASGMHLIHMLAPTSSPERIRAVAGRAEGFIYLISVAGVTGARQQLPAALPGLIGGIKALTNTPVCVGFGISTPAQAAEVGRMADGAIVGSRLVQAMDEDPSLEEVCRLVKNMKQALHNSAK